MRSKTGLVAPATLSALALLLAFPWAARAEEPCADSTSRANVPLPSDQILKELTEVLAFPNPKDVGSLDGLYLFDVRLPISDEGESLQLRAKRFSEGTEGSTERFALVQKIASRWKDELPLGTDELDSLSLQERLLLLSVTGKTETVALQRLRTRLGFERVLGSNPPLFRDQESRELYGQIGSAILKFGFVSEERAAAATYRILARQNIDAAASVWNTRSNAWLAAKAANQKVPPPAQLVLDLGKKLDDPQTILAGLGETHAWKSDPGKGETIEGIIGPRNIFKEEKRTSAGPFQPTSPQVEENPWLSNAPAASKNPSIDFTPTNISSLKKLFRDKGLKPLVTDLRRSISNYFRNESFLADFKTRTSPSPAQFMAPMYEDDMQTPTQTTSEFGPMVTRLKDTTLQLNQSLPSSNSRREFSSELKLDPFRGTTTSACVTDAYNRGKDLFSYCAERSMNFDSKRETRARIGSTSARSKSSLNLRLGAALEFRREDGPEPGRTFSTKSLILSGAATAHHIDAPGPVKVFSNFVWDFPVVQGNSSAIIRQELGARSCDRQDTCIEVGIRHQSGAPLYETDLSTQAQVPARSVYITYSRQIF